MTVQPRPLVHIGMAKAASTFLQLEVTDTLPTE